MTRAWKSVVALSGGVGGARFVHGLAAMLPPDALTVVVNTGDDFIHWSLRICPDLDTVMYTLSGIGDEERGWGLPAETFRALEMVRRYGGDDWFKLGDRDLGTHIVRTEALSRGDTLSQVTRHLCESIKVEQRVLPMTDASRPTMIDTADLGTLEFQHWFVKHKHAPHVTRVWYQGEPEPAPGVLDAIAAAEVVIIGPSNPYVSIDPILTLPGVRDAVAARPVVAVSPIVRGRAVKGPLADMIKQLTGEPASAAAIARHYGELLDGIVVERGDDRDLGSLAVSATNTIMGGIEDRARLAAATMALAETVA